MALTPGRRRARRAGAGRGRGQVRGGRFPWPRRPLLVTAEVGPPAPSSGPGARPADAGPDRASRPAPGWRRPAAAAASAQRLQDLDPRTGAADLHRGHGGRQSTPAGLPSAGRIRRRGGPGRLARLAPYGSGPGAAIRYAARPATAARPGHPPDRRLPGRRSPAQGGADALPGAQPLELDWLCASYNIVAMDLWDDEAWFELADGQRPRWPVDQRHPLEAGLPFGLDYLAELHIQAGEKLSQAAALLPRPRANGSTRDQGGHPALRPAPAQPRGAGMSHRPRTSWPGPWRAAPWTGARARR